MAEVDISPELLEELKNEFWKQYNGNGKINAAVEALRGSEGLNYKEAYNYSLEVGKSLSEALREKARSDILPDGRMYYNIADKALRPMLENNYRLISDYCVRTQNALNERAGIGIKGVAAPINEDRINGLLNVAAAAQQFDDIVGEFCRECENYSLSVVDEHIKKNAEIQNSAGLSPKIERYCGHSGCDWCSSLAGTYEYEKVKDTGNDVFRRHRGCTCTVVFIPINGKAENAHSKYYIPDKELIELRKNYVGIDRSGRGGIIEGKGGGYSERGISGKHDRKTKENSVNLEYLKSDEYKNKFKGITANEKVNEQIYRQSKAILTHRNGTDKEDLILIDSITGKIAGRQCNSQIDFVVEYNKSVTDAIKGSQPYSLISIHNHSTNNPPTGNDLVCNGAYKYKLGIVATHNGRVFTYKAGNMPFAAESFGSRVDKYRSMNYNEFDAIIKTLSDFTVEYGIEWSER